MPTTHLGTLGVLITFLLESAAPQAQRPNRLATARAVKCTFPLVATGTWTSAGAPQAEVKTAPLSVAFEQIDIDEGTARAIGEFVKADIIVKLLFENLHFMQVFSAGSLYTTTIFNKPTSAGKFKAVHSRHEFTDVRLLGFTSRPEQYYGECQVE